MKWRTMLAVSMAGVALLAACGGSGGSEDAGSAGPTAQPTLELTSLERDYLFQVKAAWDLFGTKAASFRGVFAQAWPTHERLFTALYDAGAGTAWVGSLEATEKLEPPRLFRDDHEILLAGLSEIIRIDAEIGETLKDGKLVEFVVLNSELGVTAGLLLTRLSPPVCQALVAPDAPNPPCQSKEQLPGAEYGLQLELIMLRFETQLGPRLNIWGEMFLPLADEETFLAGLSKVFPLLVSMTEATLEELSQLSPPEDLRADHDFLVQYVTNQRDRALEIIAAIEASDEEKVDKLAETGLVTFCETQDLLSADALAITHGHFAGDAPCSEILP